MTGGRVPKTTPFQCRVYANAAQNNPLTTDGKLFTLCVKEEHMSIYDPRTEKCERCEDEFSDTENIEMIEATGFCLRCDHLLTDWGWSHQEVEGEWL